MQQPHGQHSDAQDQPKPNRQTTPRGFAIYDRIIDTHGQGIRVQHSSAYPGEYVWIFVDEPSQPAAAHLSVEQAKRIRNALDAFIQEKGD